MDIAIDDEKLYNLQLVIDGERKKLEEKRGLLRNQKQHNLYLEKVYNDYDKYNRFIKSQKKEQELAFEELLNHLQKIHKSMQSTDSNLASSLKQEKDIMHQIDTIKEDLEKMVDS